MMRQITVDYTKPTPCGMKNAGRIGEHNATELIIIPPAFLSANEKVFNYIIAFAVECKVIHSEPIAKTDELKIPLWEQLTQSEILTVQLEGYDSAGAFIGKSEPVRLRFLHSVCGEDVPADTDNHDFMSDYLKSRHFHSNKDVLDNFAQDESGNPLYNGKAIGGGSGLTDEQATDLEANTKARHTHSNKEYVLDKFSINENSELLFDGQPIKAEGVVENANPYATMAQTVALLLENALTEMSTLTAVSIEAPAEASLETSRFANSLYDLSIGGVTIYAPSEDGILTYTDPASFEPVELKVEVGGIYEFYIDLDLYETRQNSYTGSGVLEFFKSKILADCVTEAEVESKIQKAIKDGNYVSEYDLVNYRHISQSVPADEVSYSNPILEDKSGTIKGALDEAVDYVTTAIPAIQEAVDGKQEKGDFVTNEQLNEKLLSVSGLSVEVVDSLPEENINTSTIYLVPSSVNVIKSSLDMFEEDVYNGKGYAENTIYVPAFGEDTEKDGVCITGFIPIVGGDAFTLKNIEYNRDNADCKVYILAYAGATPVIPTADELTTSYKAKWDSEGNLISFKLPSNIGSNKYLRIQASYIGDDSSIVVNETEDNVYAEYIYVNDKWECVGSAKNGADGYTPVKGVDYFTEAEKSEIIEEVTASIDVSSDSANAIPDYWQSALDEGVEAINTALMTAGYNKSAFLFYSDVHWNYGSQMSPKLLKYLYQHTGMTKTNFGGDIVNDEATDYDGMEYLWDWRNQLKDLPNHHSVVGNHDDGNSTNNLFSEQYVYGYLLAAEETPEVVRGAEGMYYYIDHSPEKTRYLYLDTAYKGATDKQQAFVKEALLSTPEGWHIVAVSHIWHDTIYSGANREVGDLNANASVFLAMFDNYNSRIGDYADCGGWVEFCVGGHTHLDHDSTSGTGIPIILVATDSQHTGGATSFTYETDTEASVNGIIADYDNHKIYVVRIGRGESRTIDVTNYVVTYTNVLPTSIDTDGSVYNGVGYKANVRWSTSSNAESTYEGAYLSGYISAPAGDIVRLKNITMSNTDTTNKLCCIYFCPELGDMSNSLQNASTIGQFASPVWDDNGNLIQFTSTAETKYIRLQAAYIGPDSVVTINEPLE